MIRSVIGPIVGFAILSLVFGLLERWSPAVVPAPRRSNRGLRTDLLYWIFTPIVTNKLFTSLPLLALGFAPGTLKTYAPLLTFYAIFVHASVNWDFGPLRHVAVTPVFHRWHHSKDPAALDTNFAGLLPLWDWLFGTLYMPRDRWPEDFGTHDAIPDGLAGQLAYPFRR